ncbi:MAG: hypothetical protein ABEI77_05455 [Halorientalis sp.]
MQIDCPDCGVRMEQVTFGMQQGLTESQTPFVRTPERREGLLGQLGVHEQKRIRTLMCPECGLLRQYARLDE